ncbi:hypothetical protein LDENG_00109280, partial [Lucifuga dentata]
QSSLRPSRPPAPPLQEVVSSHSTATGKPSLYPNISSNKAESSDTLASRNSQSLQTYRGQQDYQSHDGGPVAGTASGPLVVMATHAFTGQQPGDLTFAPGDRITVITKTDSQYDWWEGQLDDGQVGIFPANFVKY